MFVVDTIAKAEETFVQQKADCAWCGRTRLLSSLTLDGDEPVCPEHTRGATDEEVRVAVERMEAEVV